MCAISLEVTNHEIVKAVRAAALGDKLRLSGQLKRVCESQNKCAHISAKPADVPYMEGRISYIKDI